MLGPLDGGRDTPAPSAQFWSPHGGWSPGPTGTLRLLAWGGDLLGALQRLRCLLPGPQGTTVGSDTDGAVPILNVLATVVVARLDDLLDQFLLPDEGRCH